MIKFLFEKSTSNGTPFSPDEVKDALFNSLSKNKQYIAKYFIENSDSINLKNEDEMSPLMFILKNRSIAPVNWISGTIPIDGPDISFIKYLVENKVGIWNKSKKLTETVRSNDRIEIYRPLIADPKQVRKARAEKAKEQGRADKVTGGRPDPQRQKSEKTDAQ